MMRGEGKGTDRMKKGDGTVIGTMAFLHYVPSKSIINYRATSLAFSVFCTFSH